MKTYFSYGLTAVCVLLMSVSTGQAVELLSPTDFIIAIDTDDAGADSAYPGGEGPGFVVDQDSGTKYLNHAGPNTGFITTPFFAGETVQSIRFTTGNDAPLRDPSSWELYGTNSAIVSTDNSFGDAEPWTLIASDTVALPEDRLDSSTFASFSNSAAYNSYKVVFPTLKGGEDQGMQISDIQLYNGPTAGVSDDEVFGSGDPTIAIGLDPLPASEFPGGEAPLRMIDGFGLVDVGSTSNYPGGENPGLGIDDNIGTKYLNFAGENSGFIVTPSTAGAVQSFQLSTANDAEFRDPASWVLYGTNEAIVSEDNSLGNGEAWTELDSGSLALPAGRGEVGAVVSVANTDSYSSYKMVFPTIKDAVTQDIMQVAEVSFFTSTDGTGSDLLQPGDSILAIDEDSVQAEGTATKYLNFGKENSGFIVKPNAGTTVLNEFQLTTANDADARDPQSWEIYGTNDAIVSEENSKGDGETWTLIASGDFNEAQVPLARETTGESVTFANTTEYAAYRMIFTELRDTENANSMQVANIQFFGDIIAVDVDLDDDGDVDGADFLAIQRTDPSLIPAWEAAYGTTTAAAVGSVIPEPATAALMLMALMATLAKGRGRASRA